jgi:hypothetical protein
VIGEGADWQGLVAPGLFFQAAKLAEANLSQADLQGADLRRAELVGAQLVDADLSGATLVVARLMQANLQHASLRGADLYEANPTDANFRGVNAAGARLLRLALRGTDLAGATLTGADLYRADLRGVLGLTEVRDLASARFHQTIITAREHEVIVAALRDGPLAALPGPPSPVRPTGAVAVLASGAQFSLSARLSDGAPEVVEQRLQQLPPPLEFVGVDLGADAAGNYLVAVRGRLRRLLFRRGFVYRRAVRLVGNFAPGRPSPPVLAELVGAAAPSGVDVRRYAAVLDRAITEAVERQLDVAVSRIAALELERTGAGFALETVSVSALELTGLGSPPGVNALVRFGAGAITGQILPPTPG